MQSVVSHRRGWVAHALLAVACPLLSQKSATALYLKVSLAMPTTLPRPAADAVRISGLFLATHQADLFTGTTSYAPDATTPLVRKADRAHMGGKESRRWSPITRVSYARATLVNAHKAVTLCEENLPADVERADMVDVFLEVSSIVNVGRAVPKTVADDIAALDVKALRATFLKVKTAKAKANEEAAARKAAKAAESAGESVDTPAESVATVSVEIGREPTVSDIMHALTLIGSVSLAEKLALASAVSSLTLSDVTPATVSVGA